MLKLALEVGTPEIVRHERLRQGGSLGPVALPLAGMSDQPVPVENGMRRGFGGHTHVAGKLPEDSREWWPS